MIFAGTARSPAVADDAQRLLRFFPIGSRSWSVVSCSAFGTPSDLGFRRSKAMEWITPQHEEIDLNCEISSYANAEL